MTANVKVEGDIACKECGGTGMLIPDCEECEGNGWVPDESDGGTMCCPACGGDECEHCEGSGEAPVPAKK